MKYVFFALALFAFFGGATWAANTEAATPATVAQNPADIPVEVFAALPSVSRAKISPNGKVIAYFLAREGRRHLVIQNLDGSDTKIIPPWHEKLDFNSVFWKSDDMLLFRVSLTLNRYEFHGKSHETRMLSFDLETDNFKWLGKPKRQDRLSQLERVVDYLSTEPNHVLIEMDFKLDGSPAVYRVNVNNGRRKIYKPGKKGINDWYADQNANIRLGVGYRSRSSKFNATFKNADDKWVDLKKMDWYKHFDIEGFSSDPNIIFVTGQSPHGTKGLYKLDVQSGEIVEKVFSHENVDVAGIYEHPDTGRFAGISYIDDFYRVNFQNESLKILQRSLNKALPNTVNSIVSKSRVNDQYLILIKSDTNPGDYYIYDRPERKMDWVLSVRGSIDENLMAPTKAVSIPVRDGTDIPGYLTIPKGTEAKNLPTIILPHGGPTARDTADWDYEAQFYASRGYMVLKPNFRGSSGYGPAFKRAGKKQWGGLMQDDVTDATKWLITEGMADPKRICIVGSSYGGYAALMGAIKEPGLYSCAISVNGVTDLRRIKENDRSFVGGRAWTKNMGLTGSEDKLVSPYHRAKDIGAPVLLISSKDDARVPYKHSKDMHKKLKKLGKDSTYTLIKNGGHSMVTAKSRLIMLQETEKFLAKHNGGAR